MTVKGIFEDFRKNSIFYGNGVVMSLATSFKHQGILGGGQVETAICSLSVCARGCKDDVNTRIEKLAEQVRKSDDVFKSGSDKGLPYGIWYKLLCVWYGFC